MNPVMAEKKPKILFTISNIQIGGGAEKVCTTVANEFLNQGIDVELLTFYTAEKEHVFNGVRNSMHEATPASLLGKLPRALKRIWIVKKTCKENNIDLIISFLEESNYYVLLSKLLLRNKTKMIVSVRNDPSQYPRIYQWLIKILYPHAEKVVAVTKGVEQTLKDQYGLKNTTTIYNPLDYEKIREDITQPLPEEYRWIEKRSPLFITIGRLAQQKGQWYMISAFAHLVKEKPDAPLVIIGEGPYRERLTQLIKELGLENHVYLIGKQKNVYQFLQIADVFILTSLWEGMPNVLLEALASGSKVVATDASTGAREILAPQIELNKKLDYPFYTESGVLVEPFNKNDNRSDLEKKLAEVFLNEIDTIKVGDMKIGQRFSLPLIFAEWMNLYHKLYD